MALRAPPFYVLVLRTSVLHVGEVPLGEEQRGRWSCNGLYTLCEQVRVLLALCVLPCKLCALAHDVPVHGELCKLVRNALGVLL